MKMDAFHGMLAMRVRLARGDDVMLNLPAVMAVLLVIAAPRLTICGGVIAYACGYRFSLEGLDAMRGHENS